MEHVLVAFKELIYQLTDPFGPNPTTKTRQNGRLTRIWLWSGVLSFQRPHKEFEDQVWAIKIIESITRIICIVFLRQIRGSIIVIFWKIWSLVSFIVIILMPKAFMLWVKYFLNLYSLSNISLQRDRYLNLSGHNVLFHNSNGIPIMARSDLSITHLPVQLSKYVTFGSQNLQKLALLTLSWWTCIIKQMCCHKLSPSGRCQSINQPNFYSTNIPGTARYRGATSKSVHNSKIDEAVPQHQQVIGHVLQ